MSFINNYAKALYLSVKVEEIESVTNNLKSFLHVILSNSDLFFLLKSPILKYEKKNNLILEVSRLLKMKDISRKFICILVKNGRINYLSKIIDSIDEISTYPGVIGKLYSPKEVDLRFLSELEKLYAKKLNVSFVKLKVIIDPKLILGIKVCINGVTYDGSLSHSMNRLKEVLLTNKE